MKTAIYIEDGVVQLVLTPESRFERNAISSFKEKNIHAQIFSGSFYDCRGGWTRQSDYFPNVSSHMLGDDKDESVIIRVVDEREPKIITKGD